LEWKNDVGGLGGFGATRQDWRYQSAIESEKPKKKKLMTFSLFELPRG
jgi:hypothetical protein